tara:strand:- start:272 stop:703 length:432 start_codon:yes stop_codon:yes gene_type:complete
MSNGFGDFVPDVKGKKRHENWAERSLEKSARELKMLRKVIEQYKDDPNGKRKMLKKMRRLWRSNLQEVKNMDYKPKGEAWVPPTLVDQDETIEDPRETEGDSVDNMKEEDMSRIRDILNKNSTEDQDAHDQSAPEIQPLPPHG